MIFIRQDKYTVYNSHLIKISSYVLYFCFIENLSVNRINWKKKNLISYTALSTDQMYERKFLCDNR